jgi:hypothetical protein
MVLCSEKAALNVPDNYDYLLFYSWSLDSFKP